MTRFLRTGESEYCICGHHLECHNTILGKWQTCNYNYRGKSHRCTCKRFRAYRLMGEGSCPGGTCHNLKSDESSFKSRPVLINKESR
jgi:hypothetical protein